MQVFVVINPVAGRYKGESIKNTIQRQLDAPGWQLEFHETTREEQFGDIVRQAIQRGAELVIAAGGDGTVSQVADGAALTGVPLGIVPSGTSNVVAQELGIPLNIDRACQLIAGSPLVKEVDAIQLGEQFFILAVGTGIDAEVMKSVSRESKRRFGPAAYAWSTLKVILGMQPRVFTIIADGKPFRTKASVVLLSNVATLTRPLRWGPHIKPDDGWIDINIVRGKHLLDYLLTAYDVLPGPTRQPAHVRRLRARQSVIVYSDESLLVQGDGDLIGQTPLEVKVVPGAVKVLVPPTEQPTGSAISKLLPDLHGWRPPGLAKIK